MSTCRSPRTTFFAGTKGDAAPSAGGAIVARRLCQVSVSAPTRITASPLALFASLATLDDFTQDLMPAARTRPAEPAEPGARSAAYLTESCDVRRDRRNRLANHFRTRQLTRASHSSNR